MDKIKITLTSGKALEKPLVSAFKGTNSSYVVLDNEVNGTMGLPIILVSKFDGTKLSKIEDPTEWGSVKDTLRNIISGNQMDYINVPANVMADDIFFSQLTLPVASFESLKANYKVNDGAAPEPAAPVAPAPVEQPIPSVQPVPEAPVVPQPETPVTPIPVEQPIPSVTPDPVAPVAPQPETPVTPAPVEQPIPSVVPPMPEAPKTPDVPVTPVAPVVPEAPVIPSAPAQQEIAPVVDPIPASNSQSIDFSADKEAFLKACENMFDALVAKFNK